MTPQRIAVVGGHGQVARLLHPRLVAAGQQPVALVRRPEQAEAVRDLGAEPRMLDLEAQGVEEYARELEGCDAVVFAAGGGPDGDAARKRTVDLGASLRSQEAARLAGIERFLQVSAIGVDDPLPDDTEEVWRAYVEAKRDADAALRGTDLRWTVLRPGRLTDDPATGRVALAPSEDRSVQRGDVTRDDVAAAVVALLADDRAVHRTLDLVGGDVPLEEALAALGA